MQLLKKYPNVLVTLLAPELHCTHTQCSFLHQFVCSASSYSTDERVKLLNVFKPCVSNGANYLITVWTVCHQPQPSQFYTLQHTVMGFCFINQSPQLMCPLQACAFSILQRTRPGRISPLNQVKVYLFRFFLYRGTFSPQIFIITMQKLSLGIPACCENSFIQNYSLHNYIKLQIYSDVIVSCCTNCFSCSLYIDKQLVTL